VGLVLPPELPRNSIGCIDVAATALATTWPRGIDVWACKLFPCKSLGFDSLPYCPLSAFVPLSHSQQPPVVTLAQFKATAHTIGSSAEQWRKTIDSVSVDGLPVDYATGKAYEQSKQVVSQDLRMAVLWGDRAEKSDSLYDQINYMSSVQELQSQLQLFNGLLSDFSVRDAAVTAKVQAWADALNNIANGPLEAAFGPIFNYTTRHALQIEQTCAK
jgi:hypothetical protein